METKWLLKKVLVVDDQVENRNAVKDALKAFDVEIVEAENGKAAVALCIQDSDKTFDLITMDYLMPEMNGAQAVSRIRALNPDVPIICISASIKLFRPQVAHFNNLFFLDKPLDVGEFLHILTHFVW